MKPEGTGQSLENHLEDGEKCTDDDAHLRRMQGMALACVAVAALIFIITIFLPPTFLVRLIKAGSEAAMVGGLADWFAVVALFRHPLNLPIRHTAIIPKSKDRIADNLARFVRDKFLNPAVVTELIRNSDPAQRMAAWLSLPATARRIGRHSADLMSGLLDLVDDRRIQGFINDAARTVLGRMDFSQALASVLEMLTKGGRHQQLLDAVLLNVVSKLGEPDIQKLIAARVVDWLRQEHKIKQVLLPTEWLGDKAAEVASEAVSKFLLEVSGTPAHELRAAFDKYVQTFISRLRNDEEFHHKGEEFKSYVLKNHELAEYARSVWASLRDWLSNDLEASSPLLQQQVERVGLWFGQKLTQDEDLRTSINEHAESLAASAAPQFAEFLTCHISDTVRKWDAKDMSRQIELSIGPDLQYIRISGTVVGCVIGVALFLISQIGEMV